MGLYKKGGSNWYAAFSADGRHFNRSTGVSNKRRAQQILDTWRAEIIEGRFNLLKSKSPTFKDWSRQFLESIPHPNTRKRYAVSKVALDAFFGDARLPHITASRIEEFKRTRLGAKVKSATVNRDLALLRQLLKRADRERYIARNPFETGEFFLEERKGRQQPHILGYEEEMRLVSVASPMLKALVILLVETGLRVGKEALPLKWTDIDLTNGTLCVRESKTLAGRRMVPLSDYCKGELLRCETLTRPDTSARPPGRGAEKP
jgi:integrase